ncbi:MAG: DUF692 family multinuclear iron-containing protein [Bacteroidota bacterium]
MKIYSTLACNFDSYLLQAAFPLLEAEKVQAIEWSFDALFKISNVPAWFTELLDAFGKEGRLVGHGVYFSIFSGKWSPGQQAWLEQLKQLASAHRFDHVTEHFGFMTGEDFHKGAPMSVPVTAATLAIGIDRLKRLQAACQCPVGLENLAFAYSLDEVKKHGDFLRQLVEPVNGFLILDLHNFYCQLQNFDLDWEELLSLYPLELVREIHISGGSWEDAAIAPGKKIRRDTHDDTVPPEVFMLLEKAIEKCPNLKFVVMEQLSSALQKPENQALFRKDFLAMDEIVQRENERQRQPFLNSFLPKAAPELGLPTEDESLHRQQSELSKILETASGYEDARNLLSVSSLANSAWEVENWEPCMLETALRIAQKWRDRF